VRTARCINKIATAVAQNPVAMKAMCTSPAFCQAALGKLTLATTKLARANTIIVAGVIGMEAVQQIMAWRAGTVSGAEAMIETSVAVVALAGGAAGSSAGAATGAVISAYLGLGKGIGAAVGGVIGGLWGGKEAEKTFRWTIGKVFTLPPKKQIADCYNILGVDDVSTNDDVNRAYRKKAMVLHPDKIGNDPKLKDDWFKLESCMALIRLEREEHEKAPEVVEMANAWFGQNDERSEL
jgi:hypothetical protein